MLPFDARPYSWAAGAIHGDFERGFICAEVMAYADLKELGTELEAGPHCLLIAHQCNRTHSPHPPPWL
jgi:ribosome-binding ATPase YchF (GTP1/OBG family)